MVKWVFPFLLLLLLPQPLLADCEGEDDVSLRVKVVEEEQEQPDPKRQYSWDSGPYGCPPESYGRDPFSVFEESEVKPPQVIHLQQWYLDYLQDKQQSEQAPEDLKEVEEPSPPPSSDSFQWYYYVIIVLAVMIITLLVLWLRDYRKLHWKRYYLD